MEHAEHNRNKSANGGLIPSTPAKIMGGLRQVVRQQTLTLPPVVRIHQPLPSPHVPKTAFSGTRFRDMSTKTPFGVHITARLRYNLPVHNSFLLIVFILLLSSLSLISIKAVCRPPFYQLPKRS